MERKSEASTMLLRFIQECGKPEVVRSDNAKEYTHGSFMELCKK